MRDPEITPSAPSGKAPAITQPGNHTTGTSRRSLEKHTGPLGEDPEITPPGIAPVLERMCQFQIFMENENDTPHARLAQPVYQVLANCTLHRLF